VTSIFAALCYAKARPMPSCGVCLSVCQVRGSCQNESTLSSKFVHHRVTIPFYFFHTKQRGDIPTGTLQTWASNAGGVGKKRDSGRISGFTAYRSTVLSTVPVAKCEKQRRDERQRASSTPPRPLFAQDDDEVFVTGSTLYATE